ncbi:MAG: AraC family transcriptional regulator [Bacteroidota bacterium]
MLESNPIFPKEAEKNNAKRTGKYYALENGIGLTIIKAAGDLSHPYLSQPKPELIQFYFVLGGKANFVFPRSGYQHTVPADHVMLLYRPKDTEALEIQPEGNTHLLGLFIHLHKLHELLTHDLNVLPFLEQAGKEQSFHEERNLSSSLSMVVSQMFNESYVPSNDVLYYQGKSLELLSFYFHQEESDAGEKCPFLLDEYKINQLRQAKRIVQEQMLQPPTLKELARIIGLNEYQLKVGFKNVYGKSVFQYLTEYKMEYARKLLDEQHLRVNEVSDKVGYSSPSHFIVAFKRHFGVTPKKYLMALR